MWFFLIKCIKMETLLTNLQIDEICVFAMNGKTLYNRQLKIIAEIQYITGARANDVIEFNRWSEYNSTQLLLQPQKGNNARIFNKSDINNDFVYGVVNNENILEFETFRKYDYYLKLTLNRFGLSVGNKGINTHIFRHNYAKKLKDDGSTDVEIKDLLGEVRQSSANSYIYSNVYGFI